MNPLVVIPARGGSKGIPKKNIRKLAGKPLIQYTIDVARELFDDQQICVSTDSPEIKSFVESLGLPVPFLRPEHLSTDTASTYDVLLHALSQYEKRNPVPGQVVLLQPTSPFRKSLHISEAMELFEPDLDMVVSVVETKSNPYYVLFEEDENGWLHKSKKGNFKRRQDCPKVWEYNGAVYIINTGSLRATQMAHFKRIRKYIMDEKYSLDLDTTMDWHLAECLMGMKMS